MGRKISLLYCHYFDTGTFDWAPLHTIHTFHPSFAELIFGDLLPRRALDAAVRIHALRESGASPVHEHTVIFLCQQAAALDDIEGEMPRQVLIKEEAMLI